MWKKYCCTADGGNANWSSHCRKQSGGFSKKLKIDTLMNKEDIWWIIHPSWTSSFLDSIQQNFQSVHFECYHHSATITAYFSLWNQINRCVSTLRTSLWNPINMWIYKSDSNGFSDFWNFVVSLVAQMVKNPFTTQETWVWSLGQEDPLEKRMTIHSSILAWRIPMDRGAWWSIVHGVAKSQTQLSDEQQKSHLSAFSFTVSINYLCSSTS